MAMKSYTNIEQSRKLAEILPLESADMHYWKMDWGTYRLSVGHSKELQKGFEAKKVEYIPCWSLASLLSFLPKSLIYTPNQALDGYCCKNIMHDLETYGDNPVDACVEMIVKLHELKKL